MRMDGKMDDGWIDDRRMDDEADRYRWKDG